MMPLPKLMEHSDIPDFGMLLEIMLEHLKKCDDLFTVTY